VPQQQQLRQHSLPEEPEDVPALVYCASLLNTTSSKKLERLMPEEDRRIEGRRSSNEKQQHRTKFTAEQFFTNRQHTILTQAAARLQQLLH
jgi:hypothetical protein